MSKRCPSPKCDYCGPLPSAQYRDDRNAKPWRTGDASQALTEDDEYDGNQRTDDECDIGLSKVYGWHR